MRFMILMYPGKRAESGEQPSAELVGEMMKLNEQLAAAGVLLALDGLHSTATGARVRRDGHGKKAVIDGPFTEAKELIGGYWLIQVRSREEALEWAKRIPLHDDDTFVEVRQVHELAEFPPEVQKLAGPLERALRPK
jgi:hypothetical protein